MVTEDETSGKEQYSIELQNHADIEIYRTNDGEKSIVALVETVNAIRTMDTVPDNCPVEEH